jgi:hypothetical protein
LEDDWVHNKLGNTDKPNPKRRFGWLAVSDVLLKVLADEGHISLLVVFMLVF